MPPHNLFQVIDACEAYIDNREARWELMTCQARISYGGYAVVSAEYVDICFECGRSSNACKLKLKPDMKTHDKIIVRSHIIGNKAELIKYIADLTLTIRE